MSETKKLSINSYIENEIKFLERMKKQTLEAGREFKGGLEERLNSLYELMNLNNISNEVALNDLKKKIIEHFKNNHLVMTLQLNDKEDKVIKYVKLEDLIGYLEVEK